MSKWDAFDVKFILCVQEGRSLTIGDSDSDSSDPFVKVKTDNKKYSFQTKTKLKTLSPIWRQLFFMPHVPKEITAHVWDKDAIGKDFLGLVEIPVHDLVPEVPRDIWYKLAPRDKDVKRNTKISGELRVSLLVASGPSIRTSLPVDYTVTFWHQHFLSTMQTGDLILYSGCSAIDSAVKAYTAVPYSNVGIVVRMPSKWTEAEEVYVFEAIKNENDALDVLAETKRGGICCFKLVDRLHNFVGNSIWYCPLSSDKKFLTTWLTTLHNRRPLLDYKEKEQEDKERKKDKDRLDFELEQHSLLQDSQFVSFLSELGVDVKKDPSEAHSLYGGQLVGRALKKLNLISAVDDCSGLTIPDVLKMDMFASSPHFILRCNEAGKDKIVATLQGEALAYASKGQSFPLGRLNADLVRLPSATAFTDQQKQIDAFDAITKYKVGDPVPAVLQHGESNGAKKKKPKTEGKKKDPSTPKRTKSRSSPQAE